MAFPGLRQSSRWFGKIGLLQKLKLSPNPHDWRAWCIVGWIALHEALVHRVEVGQQYQCPKCSKNGLGVVLDAVNECHVLCLSPLKRTKT